MVSGKIYIGYNFVITMKQELMKSVIKVGNGAGVLVPREWLNGKARIELIEKPLDIKRDVVETLEPYLEEVIGIYLVGSYARNEQNAGSDVDIIALTSNIDKRIISGKYDILLISIRSLEDSLKNNLLPILPMLIEAKTLLNSIAIESYRKTKLTERNLRFHIETTNSALKVMDKAIELAELEGKELSENIIYSFVLRLREVYIIDCLKNNGLATTKGLISLVKKLTGSDKSYKLYLNAKNECKKSGKFIGVNEAINIRDYIRSRIKEQKI